MKPQQKKFKNVAVGDVATLHYCYWNLLAEGMA